MESALLVESAASSIPQRASIPPLPCSPNSSSSGIHSFCRNYLLSQTCKQLRKWCHGGCRRGLKGRSSSTRTHRLPPLSCSPSLTVPLRNQRYRPGDSINGRDTHVDISSAQGGGVRLPINVNCKHHLYVLPRVLIRGHQFPRCDRGSFCGCPEDGTYTPIRNG